MSGLLDQVRALAPETVGALAGLTVILVVLAASVQVAVWRRRVELREISHDLVDERTGLLPRTAIPVRLGAELGWGAAAGTQVSVVAMRLRGAGFVRAAGVLRRAMRDEEQAYLLGDDRVVVELWDAGPHEAARGVQRFGAALLDAGFDVVDAGVACAPRDGDDAEELVSAAVAQLRPVDDQPPGRELGAPVSGPIVRMWRVLSGVLPWFAAMGLLLLSCWRLLPAALEPSLETLHGRELAAPIATLGGIAIAGGLLWTTCWNFGGGHLPRSRPTAPGTWRSTAFAVAVLGGLLALGAAEPRLLGAGPSTLGAALAVLVLVAMTIAQARQLVHANVVTLLALFAAGAAIVWASVSSADLPVVANAGRLLAAAALGALLARAIERPSWMVLLSLLVAGVDAWSVLSNSGVSRQLLESHDDNAGRALDLLLFTGPHVHGAPLFVLGTTDLVFLALYICWAHDWRMDVRQATAVLPFCAGLALVWSTALDAAGDDSTVPVLPLLAAGMVLLVAGRWGRLALIARRDRRRHGAGASPRRVPAR